MNDKIEICKTCNGTGIEYDGAGHTCTACNGVAAQVVERREPIGYRCRFHKEPGNWMVVWGKPVPLDRNPNAEYQLLYAEQPAPVALTIPEECPHLIMFDDTERENLLFSGAGARSAALKVWEQISMSWNAHLFVRVERNSRDDRYPSATSAPVAVVLPRDPEKAFFEWTDTLPSAPRCLQTWLAAIDKVKELNQ